MEILVHLPAVNNRYTTSWEMTAEKYSRQEKNEIYKPLYM